LFYTINLRIFIDAGILYNYTYYGLQHIARLTTDFL